jgi:hypothetical protein
MTPLRQRSIADLQRRHDSPTTPPLSGECGSRFARSFKRSPELLGPEHRRADQRSLVHEQKRAWSRCTQTVCALRVLDRITLGQDGRLPHLPFPRAAKPLPMVRRPPDVAQCLAAIPPLTYRTVLMTAYAAGWRLSEARHVPVAAREAPRLGRRVRQGPGPQDRDLRRSPTLLAR